MYETLYINIFFFQAEDGIRDHCVTGVQTCALPIWCGPTLSRTALRTYQTKSHCLRLGHRNLIAHRPVRCAFDEGTDFGSASFFAVLHHDDHVPGTVVRHVEPQRRWLLRTGGESCTNDAQEQNRREMDLHIESPSEALHHISKALNRKVRQGFAKLAKKTGSVLFEVLSRRPESCNQLIAAIFA